MSLSQYILDAREQYRLEVRERSTWLARVRWYYLAVLASVTIVASQFTANDAERNGSIAISVATIGLVVNTILWALTKPKNQQLLYYKIVVLLQLLLDIALAASVVYLQYGLASRATVLFAIPIVGAGLLFTRILSYLTAVLSAIGYAFALVLYQQNNPNAYELDQTVLPIIFYGAVFMFIAIIVSAFSRRAAGNEREKSYAELLSLLRHQLYHPASVMSAIIDMLEHGKQYPKWPDHEKNYLQQLKRENRHMHTMVTNMLESITDTDEELTEATVIDIVTLLNEEAVSCATSAKRIADLKTELPNKVIEVEGDLEQLKTAFDNIINNAFRYTESGTPVIISANEENDVVTISIHDKGKGISESEQRAIFRMFAKMQSRINRDPSRLYDTGLGLYVSKLIIERHKGTVEISSSADYGTNITLTLRRRLK